MFMKKLLSLMGLLLACVGARAQSWSGTEPTDDAYNHETVIYANLTTNLTGTNFIVGAFVDGECRASASPDIDPTGAPMPGAPLFTLRVKGDISADQGKTIKIRVYDGDTGCEYILPTTFTFDGQTHGVPSAGETLTLTAAEAYSLNLIEAEVGQTYMLKDYLTVLPAGAIRPDFQQWMVSDGSGSTTAFEWWNYVELTDSTLTPKVPYEGLILTLYGASDPTGAPGPELASSFFNIIQHATSIDLISTTFEVNKGDNSAMSAFMQEGVSYKLNPTGATDAVAWETNDASILQWNTSGYFEPIKGGTAKMRPYVTKTDGSKLYPANDLWITVNVVVPVTSITVDYSLFGGNFMANVGDTKIYERMQRLITVLPEDATDKSYTISVENVGVLKLTGNTALSAEGAGTGVVKLTAKGGDATQAPVTNRVTVDVVKPTTQAIITQNTLTVPLTDNVAKDITNEVKGNVTLTGDPANWATAGTVTLTGASVTATGAALDANGLAGTYTAVAEGTTTVTIDLRWPNYDAWGISSDVLTYNTAQSQFNIIVQEIITLIGFNVAVTNPVAGQTGTITLTPQPAGATFDPSAIGVTISNGLTGDWGALLSVVKKTISTEKLEWQYSSAIPCVVTVSAEQADVTGGNTPILLNDPTSATAYSFTGFEVGYPLSFDAGWQWRSNPCGAIAPEQFASIFSTADLTEIRTSNNLLFNDPSWGFYGTLNTSAGLLQGQCYKLNMKNAHESVLYGSSVTDDSHVAGTPNATDGSVSVTLKPGWTWVGSPYLFDRKLSTIFATSFAGKEGIVIIGKTGSAELTPAGTWDGDLTTLKAGEGYIIKNPYTANIDLNFVAETSLTAANESGAAGVKSFNMRGSIWQYDHSRFMNNMTMVVTLEDVERPEQYSIGAFVGEECRGEGVIVNGKAFITVHCDDGEYVTFKLYNTYTGEFRDIREGVKAQIRIGSSKAPYRMHVATTDGIDGISDSSENFSENYDLSGRRTSSQQRGVQIRRGVNGTMRKVIVK